MDVTLLRTLTEKSYLKFGKKWTYKVSNLLISRQSHLRWIYYNCSKITFTNEILDKIGIQEKDRIKKPGKDSKKRYYLDMEVRKKKGLYTKYNDAPDKFKLQAEQRGQVIRDKTLDNKERLQRINQGHK